MRKARIITLARKYKKPDERALFYRSIKDPQGMVRRLIDPATLLTISEVEKTWELVPECTCPEDMSFYQMGAFLSQIGALPDDDPCRLTDGDDTPVVTRVDSDGTTHRISDDQVIGTIPFVRRLTVVPEGGRTAMMRVPDIEMWRGVPL